MLNAPVLISLDPSKLTWINPERIMLASQFLFSTLKETPANAEITSHQLMLRAGLIRQVATGIYSWMPIGLRVLRKVEQIVREEMENTGAIELSMPIVQPGELWQKTGRWDLYGPELCRLEDRHRRQFCLGPTHEEIITYLAQSEIRSYKQLPINLFQIQTKFRDEIRPRFGVMRSREFIMKDAYSFHLDQSSQEETYWRMHEAYARILTRLKLNFKVVEADTGTIGGNHSHEFHVLAESGEDAIAFSDESNYAANVELAPALSNIISPNSDYEPTIEHFSTPNVKTIEDLNSQFQIHSNQSVKTLLAKDKFGDLVALILRGDHRLNLIKAGKISGLQTPLVLANADETQERLGVGFGSLGPVGLPLRIIVDEAASNMTEFVCGANKNGHHIKGAVWQRDVLSYEVADIREVVSGDPSPCGNGRLEIQRGIEVGHIFQLGTKYSQALGATVLDDAGQNQPMVMGCYGMGITRIVAATIEQNHDDFGIIWPPTIAPFDLAIVMVGRDESGEVLSVANRLYSDCRKAGFDVLLDDRPERPGVKFSEIELIGIPLRVIVGERSVLSGEFEIKHRESGQTEMVTMEKMPNRLLQILK